MIVPPVLLGELADIVASSTDPFPDSFSAHLPVAASSIEALTTSRRLDAPLRTLESTGEVVRRSYGPDGLAAFAPALIATLALRLEPRLGGLGLPNSITSLYPDRYRRLIDFLDGEDLQSYWRSDYFLKDARTFAGLSVPAGAADIDLNGGLNRRSGLRSIAGQKDVRGGVRAIIHGGGTWFHVHLDVRNVSDVHEEGWGRFYHRVAHALEARPSVKGVVATSWLHDPEVPSISPRLAFFQRIALANGAFRQRHGTEEEQTELATATSPTRRSLVERGEWLPVCCSIIWPRTALLDWAHRVEPMQPSQQG